MSFLHHPPPTPIPSQHLQHHYEHQPYQYPLPPQGLPQGSTKCPCTDCTLTTPISGSFTVPSLTLNPTHNANHTTHQLENHRLPTHLQPFDVRSPRVNSALRIEKGSLVEKIYLFTKYTAAGIFHEWASSEEDLVLPCGMGAGIIGAQQHLELALLGRGREPNWPALWTSIWRPGNPCPGTSAGLGAMPPSTSISPVDANLNANLNFNRDLAKSLSYTTHLLAANSSIDLQLAGFPPLAGISPHRVQVLPFRTPNSNRHGYALRIHHRRVPSGVRDGCSSYYDTPEISPIPVQEGMIRLMLPKLGVPLLGENQEMGFLGLIRLAHEVVLNEWAVEARALHLSRVGVLGHQHMHMGKESSGQEICTRTTGEGGFVNMRGAHEQSLPAVELRELPRYFRVIKAIQEVFVLNELVLQCAKPAGSMAASVHRGRLLEYMNMQMRVPRGVSTRREGIVQKRSANARIDALFVKKRGCDFAAARKASPYRVEGISLRADMYDPTMSVEPWWVAAMGRLKESPSSSSPPHGIAGLQTDIGGLGRTISPTEKAFLSQTAATRAETRARAEHAERENRQLIKTVVHGSTQAQEQGAPQQDTDPRSYRPAVAHIKDGLSKLYDQFVRVGEPWGNIPLQAQVRPAEASGVQVQVQVQDVPGPGHGVPSNAAQSRYSGAGALAWSQCAQGNIPPSMGIGAQNIHTPITSAIQTPQQVLGHRYGYGYGYAPGPGQISIQAHGHGVGGQQLTSHSAVDQNTGNRNQQSPPQAQSQLYIHQNSNQQSLDLPSGSRSRSSYLLSSATARARQWQNANVNPTLTPGLGPVDSLVASTSTDLGTDTGTGDVDRYRIGLRGERVGLGGNDAVVSVGGDVSMQSRIHVLAHTQICTTTTLPLPPLEMEQANLSRARAGAGDSARARLRAMSPHIHMHMHASGDAERDSVAAGRNISGACAGESGRWGCGSGGVGGGGDYGGDYGDDDGDDGSDDGSDDDIGGDDDSNSDDNDYNNSNNTNNT